MKLKATILATALTLVMSQLAQAATIKVVSGGAFKQVLNALAAQYEKETGDKLDITYQTVGQHLDLIRGGKEEFDVAVLTPEAIEGLVKEGKVVAGTGAALAKVGVGVVVKAGRQSPTSRRSRRSSERCSPRNRWPISIPRPAARAASTSLGSCNDSASPIR